MSAPSIAQLDIGWGPSPTDPSPLQLRFEAFHAEHPEVYRTLYDLAISKVSRMRARGVLHPRIGAKALWERMRWDLEEKADGDGRTPAYDNSLVSRYARLLMTEPGLADVFETRMLKSEGGA